MLETPYYRPRRLRRTSQIRNLVRETVVTLNDLILPFFVRPGKNQKKPIEAMPGHYQFSIDLLVKEVKESFKQGIQAIILFGIPKKKDEPGSDVISKNGIIARALKAIKDAVPDIYLIADTCFCEYTSHGHCGAVKNGDVDNDTTLELLQRQAVIQAESGVDMVAPSGMMDGMVKAIRYALDEEGYDHVAIMSYAAKYCSFFYGPFREAVESAPKFGDRKSYQMDPANGKEALREVSLDIEEGADIVMIKPALPYLDIIYQVKSEFGLPTAAYQVSGEFAMIKAAGERGWVNTEQVIMESLTAIKRAGADIIITYFAKEIANKRLLEK